MDFGELLHAAQRNEHKAKKEPKKCYNTTFSAPKKEQKSSKTLSDNIQKFLARREEEEKKKKQEARKKRDDLLALRSQDGKAKKRVAAMLNRTKAANKSAIQDAVDDDNTAVTLDGPSQPDEDDYGYVSQEASAYYNKLMDKYNSTPAEEPLFSQKRKTVHKDLSSTKDRVRMALLKQEEEEMMPHKRKRRSKTKKDDDPGDTTLDYRSSDLTDLGPDKEEDTYSDEEPEKQPVASKPKFKKPVAPPPINFQELLKLAEKKQFEPIKIEPKKKPEDDDHRPMTKKQKVEFMKEQEWRQRKEEAAKGQATSNSNQPQRIPKINRKDDSVQNQKSGTTDRGQERPSGIGQQMKIPKINSVKREEKSITQPKEEERSANSVRKDDRPMSGMKRGESIGPSRQNGNLGRDYTASTKTNLSSRDDKILKKVPKVNEDIPKKQRLDSENNMFRKSQIHEERERGKGSRSDSHNSSSNALKRLPIKTSEGKQSDDSVTIIKNFSSGYDKKLQEAIVAKMQEYQKKKRMEECASSKPAGKSLGKDLAPKGLKDIERSSTPIKGKTPSRPDRPVEQKTHVMNQKSTNINQELNSQNRPSIVPSTKPRVLPPEGKPKQVPSSASRPLSGGDVGIKPNQQTSGQRKLSVAAKPMPPPEVRPKQVPPPGVRQKQVPPENWPRQLPPADVKPRQYPPPDVKPKQYPPPDVKPRQYPPPDVKPRQYPPHDVKPRQYPPPDVKPRQYPPPEVKPRQHPPPDVKSRQYPPPDVKPRQFPPPDVHRKQFPPSDVRRNPKPPLKRRITDSEDEYDPEMDDFIDDGPEEEEDYSKHIREIFGYDRRKYSRIAEDDGDECMESNFATILKEDFISTKTGIMEDLEDIRREKEMERRKKLAKKRKP